MNIKEISWDEILLIWQEDLWKDRKSVIRPTSSMKLLGGYDVSFHKNIPKFWKLYDKDITIGCISGHETDKNSFRIRGLWIRQDHRGKKLSRLIFSHVINYARENNYKEIWSYPRHSSLNAYLKSGFKLISPPIEDNNEIHGPYYYVKIDL